MERLIIHGWVRTKRYCELKGETQDTFKKKKNKLRPNYHFKKAADGATWIHVERMDEWVEKNDFIKI